MIIWHNPRCSKSRQTLALIEDRGDIEIRRYLEDAPSRAELVEVMGLLGTGAAGMIRKGEKLFKELGLSLKDGDDALLDAMAAHPILIERPIVLANSQAAIGRPPEAALDIL